MKSTSLLFAAAAAALALAQNPGYFPGQPACAVSCLTDAITVAGCQLRDVACQCGPTQSAIGGLVLPCFVSACDSSELGRAMTAGADVCRSFSDGDLVITGTAANTSAGGGSITTSPPTATATSGATLTHSLGGGAPSVTASSTGSLGTAVPNAAATKPAGIDAGILVGVGALGVLGAL